MAGYIGTQAVSVNTTSATISDDLAVGDDALITGTLTTTAATVFNGGFASNAVSTITTADNAAQLSLISTDTDQSAGPRFDMYRNPGEAGADSDNIGQINFFGLNDNSEKTQFVYLATEINDAANGSEDSRFTIGALVAGADSSIIEYTQVTPATGVGPELVFNNTGRDINFRVESNNTAHLLFADGGEDVVGIGTPTPVPSNVAYKRAALHIHQEQGGSTGSQVHMTNAATGAAAGNGMFIAMWQDDDVYFTNQESDGNIKFATGGNNNVLVLNENGSISTTTAGTSNVRFGLNAGIDLTNQSFYNVLIGDEAGANISTGDENVAIGFEALYTESLGGRNIAIGYEALYTLAVNGYAYNVAVGYSAGSAINSGINNTIIGGLAGDAINTGSYNAAVGASALSATTIGAHNTSMGSDNMFTNILGSKSTAIGSGALYTQNPAGSSAVDMFNVAVGFNAGVAVTEGVQNTLVGALCLDNLTTGDLHTAIGYNLGPSAVDVSSEIIIGSNVNGAGTNQVRIGLASGSATLSLDGNDTSWSASSDSRLKTDVATCAVGLDFIKALRPITYKWEAKNAVANTLPQYDADSSDPVYGSGKIQHGFLAQEVKTAIDAHSGLKNGFTMWREDPDGTQQVAPTALVPMLVKAIQELEARIAVLEG